MLTYRKEASAPTTTPATTVTAIAPTEPRPLKERAAEDSSVAVEDADDEVLVAVAVARLVPEEAGVTVALPEEPEPEPVVTGAAAAVVEAAAELLATVAVAVLLATGAAVAEKSMHTCAPADCAWVSSCESQEERRQSTAARPMSLTAAQAHWGGGLVLVVGGLSGRVG